MKDGHSEKGGGDELNINHTPLRTMVTKTLLRKKWQYSTQFLSFRINLILFITDNENKPE